IFPKTIFNRPGLPHIDYRIGSYADFREYLLRALNKDPVLADWTHREPDDPGIALLEGAALIGDILTFYQELYANEAYLRTAQWRESITNLVRLTGYLLSPGVGGKATFAIQVKDKDELNKPVTVPKGFPFKAQVEGLEQAADFETLKEFEAVPALSRFNLYRPPFYANIETGVSRFSVPASILEQMELQLDVGDRLMLVDMPSNSISPRQMAVIKDIGEKFGQTEITIEGKWQQGFAGHVIAAYKLDRTFRYLGYNGPDKLVEVKNGIAVETPVSFSKQVGPVPNTFLLYQAGVYDPLPGYNYLPLDQEVEDISPGTTFLINLNLSSVVSGISGQTYFFERKVK
ncbi:MAG: hypothetical protein GY940_22255, partial [bacterium]|nr:hypothetical protein [bacterium]